MSTPLSHALVVDALNASLEALLGSPVDAATAVQSVQAGPQARAHITLAFPAAGIADRLQQRLGQSLRSITGSEVTVRLDWRVEGQAVQKNLKPLPGIRNIIAVASGKGGVGKSTVAVNLALALQAEGARVGILDADIYGPSQPLMLGTQDRPTSPDGKHMHPVRAHGLQAMSIGFLLQGEDQPMIWRGPMVTQALAQLLNETRWDDLDYLVIDLPPGTGDIQLSLAQRIPVSGAIVVTTPQDIALLDARKGLQMFRRVEVPVLGIVENMSVFCCPNCGTATPIFGSGGGQRMAQDYEIPLLGQLPLDIRIREQADSGHPTVAADPESALAQLYRDIARRAAARLAYGAGGAAFPSIDISDD